jgi:hypothetical protein
MNAFDLNRKEYIRVYNAGEEDMTNFKKVTFFTSFIISADTDKFLPPIYDPGYIQSANDNLFGNAEQYCTLRFPDQDGYACYISEMGLLNNDTDVNIPYAKVNVYIMDGRNL